MLLLTRRYLVVGLPLLALSSIAFAALPTFWMLENQADFLAGEVEGLSIASDGVISLAPATRNLYEATDPFFWSLVSDRQGNLYAGSGNDGKVYRITPTGEATVVADTNELEVHALAVDRGGNIYAGTSPRGMVYKIAPGGSQEIFFDPEDRYIWALAVDGSGNLFVATGEKGTLYRVSPGGQSEVLFSSQETHLVCLATDNDGNIYAGSDSNGLVFKIDRQGKAAVLFDTPLQEVHAIVVDSRGNVFAAAINGERRGAPAPQSRIPDPTSNAVPPAPPTIGGVTESVTVTVSAQPLASTATQPPRVESLQGAIYRISPEGSAERLWESREDLPLSLRLARDDRLMVGTGRDGRVFMVRQDKTSSLLLRVEADQVTSIYSPDENSVFFATSNPARVYRLEGGRRSEGVYRSPIKDTGTVSSMGKIRWEARVSTGTGLTIQTRTGNSSKPDNTWTAWSAGYTISAGDQIVSPRGRFLQWRAVLKSANGNGTPELLKLTAIYQQQNLSPSVMDITLHPPGQTFQKPLVTTGQMDILGLDSPIEGPEGFPGASPMSTTTTTTQNNLSLTAYSRKFYRKGFQTVTWSASDPNDDKLSYAVHYRASGESLWKLLRDDFRESVIAWDTVAMPDGRYTLRIVANDAPGNPAELALTGEKESRSFDVDNTPPRVNNPQASRSQGGHRLVFRAEDDSSAVRKVEYAVDSGKWNVIYPTDGISDSKQEDFDVTVSGYLEGVHTLVIKVTDLLENVATARVELR